jgi:hypothetical protein
MRARMKALNVRYLFLTGATLGSLLMAAGARWRPWS